jgi:hypothetical protein
LQHNKEKTGEVDYPHPRTCPNGSRQGWCLRDFIHNSRRCHHCDFVSDKSTERAVANWSQGHAVWLQRSETFFRTRADGELTPENRNSLAPCASHVQPTARGSKCSSDYFS